MKIYNTLRLPDANVEAYAKGVTTAYLGKAAGSQRIYVNIDMLPSRTYSTKYHVHSKQEEFFVILSGHGMLRLNDEKMDISKGDFLSKICGVAHQFYNSGEEPMQILDVGTVEHGDVCTYPDEGVTLYRDERKAYRNGTLLPNWDSDPNA